MRKERLTAIYIFLSITFLLGYSCKSAQFQENKAINFEIKYGKTGGFSNINPVYIINGNGKLSKKITQNAEANVFKLLKTQQIDSLQWLIEQSNLKNLNLKETGNITYFIEYKSDNEQYRISWSNETQLPEKVKEVHQYIIKLIH